ncbi:ead/Ea22-like family protein [Enterobacter cloacae]|uniref:ead/Ea22-like family protein n=1 Tax=Enterobacter cloacae TaxID=550 RepID=UPI0032AF5447
MSNIDKRALREAAEKATPGRWEYYPGNTSIEYNVDSMVEDQGSIVYVDSGDFTQKQTDLNGAFIAAANPATVLALLDELEAVQTVSAARLVAIDTTHKMFQRERDRAEKAEKRIAELEASHGNLREAMAGIHNTITGGGAYTPLAAILNASKRAYEESVAAAGKGE